MKNVLFVLAVMFLASKSVIAGTVSVSSSAECADTVTQFKKKMKKHEELKQHYTCEVSGSRSYSRDALLYGRTWYVFESGAMKYAVDHSEFQSACNIGKVVDLCERKDPAPETPSEPVYLLNGSSN